MPYIKPISGHTTTVNIRRYLTKDDRALAADYLNLKYDSRLQPDASLPIGYDWSRDMDEFRSVCNGDEPWKGRQARTYKHYVVSPDPEDRISLDQLRELTVAWAAENFGDYQVAIVYHDDNEKRIPHAHVVVNNMNLATGHRLQDPNPSALNRRLQAMADERGLSGLGIGDGRTSFQRRADVARTPMNKPITRQRIYVRKAEKEIAGKGEYSWVADIRSRVSTARSLASDEGEFRSLLAELGIEVSDNSSRNARSDWIYAIADHPTWRISGERMGAGERAGGELAHDLLGVLADVFVH
ncbi:relaxase/mobilization nuclease domain-containing protein [Slackia exigua]|uniref:relaxase/mobilization nuclease domain-containing protein n=1 Tax=Slackia exigua TaxID=84109 RepID=UPI00210DAB89|nr:relaxase/mobilization nuclease domain-containing protein [Slackia exigua]MCQ5090963.1 relaxase/mobilization nuclease domain-containing protein [Slackia exigua]